MGVFGQYAGFLGKVQVLGKALAMRFPDHKIVVNFGLFGLGGPMSSRTAHSFPKDASSTAMSVRVRVASSHNKSEPSRSSRLGSRRRLF